MKKSLGRYLIAMLIGLFPLNYVFAAEYSGVLGWANKANLSLPVSGVITEVKSKAGDRVKQGDVMLILDQRYFKAKLMAAKATTARYKPGRDEAKRELERAEELYDRTVLSQVELDKAKIDYAEKEALYTRAQALYQQAMLDMEYSELKAPYDLIVIQPKVVKGQTVVNQYQAVSLIEVASQNLFEVTLTVKIGDMEGISLGSEIEIIAAGKSGKGKVVSLEINPADVRVRVKVEVNTRAIPNMRVGRLVKVKW